MIACSDCGLASDDGILHTNQCAKVVGPHVPAPLFAAMLRVVKNTLERDERLMAEGWLARYEAWKKGLGG